MKKVLITCVNHNSYHELGQFLASVDIAAYQVKEICQVTVLIADNSSTPQQFDTISYAHIQCYIHRTENLGYINSAQYAMNEYIAEVIKSFDYCIISNVDIQLSNDFFEQLVRTDWDMDIAWIAPNIYTPSTNTEENPLATKRYSKCKLKILSILYSRPWLYFAYMSTYHKIVKRNRKNVSSIQSQQDIYAGHGSIFIFTKSFINQCFPFKYPIFLYGEENYFGEIVRKVHMRTIYSPTIQVTNTSAHISTSKIQYRTRCQYSFEAIQYILDTFY